MKNLLYLFCLVVFLFSGGNKLHANVSKNTITHLFNSNTNHNQIKFSKKIQRDCISSNLEYDINEEYSSNEDHSEIYNSNLSKINQIDTNKWYLIYDNSNFISYSFDKSYFTKPISGKTTPIYISLRVLRI